MDFTDIFQGNTVIMVMTAFLALCLVGTVTMILILVIKGDERKKMLLSKSALVTLIGAIVVLMLGFVYSTFIVPHVDFEVELNPVMYLGLIAIIFDAAYFCYRRKYGD